MKNKKIVVLTILAIGFAFSIIILVDVKRDNKPARVLQDSTSQGASLTLTEEEPTPVHFENENAHVLQQRSSSEIKSNSTMINQIPANEKLPDPLEKGEIEKILFMSNLKQIWQKQIEVMDSWPKYAEIKDQIKEDVSKQCDLTQLNIDEIIALAVEYREKYWSLGGDLSKTSYKAAYISRFLLENAHQIDPTNMRVIDELMETLQAASLTKTYDRNLDKLVLNDEFMNTSRMLRSLQFEILKRETDSKVLSQSDMLSVLDLIFIQQYYDKNEAKATLDWLKTNANQIGWDKLSTHIGNFSNAIAKEGVYRFNAFHVPDENVYLEGRYLRRLLSFKGPVSRSAVCIFDVSQN